MIDARSGFPYPGATADADIAVPEAEVERISRR